MDSRFSTLRLKVALVFPSCVCRNSVLERASWVYYSDFVISHFFFQVFVAKQSLFVSASSVLTPMFKRLRAILKEKKKKKKCRKDEEKLQFSNYKEDILMLYLMQDSSDLSLDGKKHVHVYGAP